MSVENMDDVDAEEAALLAAENAAMAAEDAAHGKGAAVDEVGDEPAADSDTPAAEPAADTTTTTETPADPVPVKVGVLGKDGTTVLPYGALKGARREASQYRHRAERAEQELADLKAGKKAEQEDGLTPEYLAELEADFPQLKPLVAAVAKAAVKPAAAAAQSEPDNDGDLLQDAIDAVPLLAGWQAEDPEKWERAKALDRALDGSPKWQGKPITERFAHVARLVADEYDIHAQTDAAPPATPAPAKTPPAKVIESAARTAPNTLSDFKGGAVDATRDNLDRMPPAQQARRFETMSDREIDAYLRKVG